MAQKEVEIPEFVELRNKKLYHQLSIKIKAYVKDPNVQKNVNLLNVYKKFVQPIEDKFNPFDLVEIVSYAIPYFIEPMETITFLESFESKVKNHLAALIFVKVLKGEVFLDEMNNQKDCLVVITEVNKLMSNMIELSPVHSKFYFLASNLYRAQGNHREYYTHFFKYMSSTDLSTIDIAIKTRHAFLLGLAALLSENIYNYGELIMHPILETLKDTPNYWLIELLNVFNIGDIEQFEKMKPQWAYIPDIAIQENKLRQKLLISCFIEMAFKQQTKDKCLSFQAIANKTGLLLDEVEMLVMKAMSLHLVKGKIDQVSECVYISWIQPRMITKVPIADMITRLDSWCTEVNNIYCKIHEQP